MAAIEFTNSPYIRSHGVQPRGRGSWAFQATAGWSAFEEQLRGDVMFFHGTLSEAKAQARKCPEFADMAADIVGVAVLP